MMYGRNVMLCVLFLLSTAKAATETRRRLGGAAGNGGDYVTDSVSPLGSGKNDFIPTSTSRSRSLQGNTLIECLDDLETAEAVDSLPGMSQLEYLQFLALQSNGALDEQFFRNIPLRLIMIYHAEACFENKSCIGLAANVNVTDVVRMTAFCEDVDEALVDLLGVPPTAAPTFSPQTVVSQISYQMRHNSGLTAKQLFDRFGGITIRDDLVRATENVVMNALNEAFINAMQRSEAIAFDESDEGILLPVVVDLVLDERESVRLRGLREATQQRKLLSINRRMQTFPDCQYDVSVQITRMIEFITCPAFVATNGVFRCVLVTSTIGVTPMDCDPAIQPQEVRDTVVRGLIQAVNDGTFVSEIIM